MGLAERRLSRATPHDPDERRELFAEFARSVAEQIGQVVIAVDEVDKKDAESVRAMLASARPLLDLPVAFVVAVRPLGLWRGLDTPVAAAFERQIVQMLLADASARTIMQRYFELVRPTGVTARGHAPFDDSTVVEIVRRAVGLPRLLVTLADIALEETIVRLAGEREVAAVTVADLDRAPRAEGARTFGALDLGSREIVGELYQLGGSIPIEVLAQRIDVVERLVLRDALVWTWRTSGETVTMTPAVRAEVDQREARKRELHGLWNDVVNAAGSTEKGRSLQSFAEWFFEEGFAVVERTLRVDTAEIDLVLEASAGTEPRFRTGHILVEVKNSSERVGSPIVSQLVGRMVSRSAQQAIILARGGVTADAEEEARNVAHDREVNILAGTDVERYLSEPTLGVSDVLVERHRALKLRPRRRP